MGLRDLARKGLGLLVVMPEEAPPLDPAMEAGLGEEVQALRKKSVAELIQEFDADGGPGAPAAEAAFDAPPDAAIQGDAVDFPTIYRQAGVAPIPFTAEQTLELIRSLPPDLPLATKRQTLEASLNTLGKALNVSKEQVLLDANRKLQALAAFEEAVRKQRDDGVAQMQERVKELQEQIDLERQKAAQAEARYQLVVKQCEAEGDRLDDVQEFLTLDEGPSDMSAGKGAQPPARSAQTP